MPLKILDAFPTAMLGSLPPFNGDGLLPPGDFAPSCTEFEERFVETGDLERRRFLYDGLKRYRLALLDKGIPENAWMLINGSFTTSKPSPGDIDIAVEVPVAKMEHMRGHPAKGLFDTHSTMLKFRCHAFAIFSLPPDDPNYTRVTVEGLNIWTKWFGATRNFIPKGRVWARTGGLL